MAKLYDNAPIRVNGPTIYADGGGLGAFGQRLAGSMYENSNVELSSDALGAQAMRDLKDLESSVRRNTAVFEFNKMLTQQKALERATMAETARLAKKAEAIKTEATPGRGFDPSHPETFATGDYKSPADAAAAPNVVEQYIRQAAQARGIDPDIAMRVAKSEGGTEVAKRGTFNTGSSWWPYQLHYGGKGTPYEHLGTVAGMGNAFTAETGFQPGDPAAWRASVDYALDRAQKSGWDAWYGARAQGITGKMGIGQTPQKPAPSGTGQPFQVNRTSQYGLGLNKQTADAFCGPAAAMALASHYGNNIPLEEVQRMAQQVGWTQGGGMAGPASQVNLLHRMGVKAQSEGWNDARAQQLIAAGTPLIIDTPGHYFLADQYDPQRGYRVGTSGTDLRQGSEWLTPAQMQRIGVAGAPRTMIYA